MFNFIKSLATGSVRYGRPRPNSDLDIAVLVTPHALAVLKAHADRPPQHQADYEDSNMGQAQRESQDPDKQSTALRFGRLNLIVTTDPAMYEAWDRATEELVWQAKMEGPIQRDRAIEVFKDYEKEVK